MLPKTRHFEFVASLPDPDSPGASESGRAPQIRGHYFHGLARLQPHRAKRRLPTDLKAPDARLDAAPSQLHRRWSAQTRSEIASRNLPVER